MAVEFERIVGVINPEATHFRQTISQLDAIVAAYPQAYYYDIETDKDFKSTPERLQKVVQSGDLVIALGGDGTKSAVASALCETDGILLPLAGGNGNDLDTGLFGKNSPLSPLEQLRQGTVVNIRPISVAVNGVQRLAVNYFGMGATGRGARTLDSHRYREKLPRHDVDQIQNIYEWSLLPVVAFFTPPFVVTEGGRKRLVTEFSAVNGPSMAKHARLPVRLEHPEAFITERATPPGLLPWAVKSLRGTLQGEYLVQGQTRTLHISRTVLQRAITGHIDAQVFDIPQGSSITLGISEKSFKAVSTSGVNTPRQKI